jgi:adenylate kinase family enzyme
MLPFLFLIQISDRGDLVPDNLITGLLLDRLRNQDVRERGWLLDGFPRTKVQADTLIKMGIKPQKFILLEVPDEVLVCLRLSVCLFVCVSAYLSMRVCCTWYDF